MSVLLTCLISLLGVVTALGLTAAADEIERTQANKEKVSSTQVLSTIFNSLDAIKAKSLSAYNVAIDKLSRIPRIESTGALNTYLVKAKRDLNNKAAQARDLATTVENSVAGYQTQVMNYANQPDSWKTSDSGKQELDTIEQKAKQVEDQASKRLADLGYNDQVQSNNNNNIGDNYEQKL